MNHIQMNRFHLFALVLFACAISCQNADKSTWNSGNWSILDENDANNMGRPTSDMSSPCHESASCVYEGSLTLRNQEDVEQLAIFECDVIEGDLRIELRNSIREINEIGNLQAVCGNVRFGFDGEGGPISNEELQSIEGFHSLEAIHGDLAFYNLPKVVPFKAFHSIKLSGNLKAVHHSEFGSFISFHCGDLEDFAESLGDTFTQFVLCDYY